MKFIKLTKPEATDLHIQSMMIVAIYSLNAKNPYDAQTRVYTFGGMYFEVMESVEEIQKKIKDLDAFIYFDPIMPKNK